MKYPNIDRERARLGLSVKQFCTAIKIHPRTFYAWKRRGKIRARYLIAMAYLFNCSVDYLLGRVSA